MHLEDEQIQRLLHGEPLPVAGAVAGELVSQHLAECAPCRLRVEEAEREERWIFDLLRQADHAAPAVDVETLVSQARGPLILGHRIWTPWLQWAAGIAIALVIAGVAYTAPGSPLPAWVDRVTGWFAGRAPESPSPEPTGSSQPGSLGIAVAPGESFEIRFAAEQSAGTATVSLTNGPEIVARALNGSATFTTGADRLTIENHGSTANYEIELPHDAPLVEIAVGKRSLLLKQGSHVATNFPTDTRGRYLIPLTPAAP